MKETIGIFEIPKNLSIKVIENYLLLQCDEKYIKEFANSDLGIFTKCYEKEIDIDIRVGINK